MASSSSPPSVPDMEGNQSPRFGNWDTGANVPYTEYFDKVVKGKTGGKLVNSSHPGENPDTFSKDEAAAPPHRTEPETELPKLSDTFSKDEAAAPPHRTEPETELPKPKHDGRAGKDGDRTPDSPTRRDTVTPKPTSVSPRHRTTSGEPQRKMYKTNGGSADRSIESSPLHPQYQVKSAGRGVGSSPWERRGTVEGSHALPITPGRPKLRTIGQGDDIPEKSSTVPPFGAWDENNPSSAENYSDIFNKVREEKQGGSAKVPIFASNSKYLYDRKPDKKFTSSSCGCCFNWGRK